MGDGKARTVAAREYFLDLAATNAAAFDTDGWYILSENDVALGHPDSGQEFLMRAEVPATLSPEPSSYLLLATGLFFLMTVGRKGRLLALREEVKYVVASVVLVLLGLGAMGTANRRG